MPNQKRFEFSMNKYRMGFCMHVYWQNRRICSRHRWIICATIIFICLVSLWIPSTLSHSQYAARRWGAHCLQNLMAQPKFDFLPNYKNPCFIKNEATMGRYVTVVDGNWKGMFEYSNNVTGYNTGRGHNQDIKLTSDHQIPAGGVADQNGYMAINMTKDSGGRLYCFPYFIIAGFPKCGITDLWHRMIQHPDIVVHPTEKEPMFFDNRRFYNDTPTIRPPLNQTEIDETWLLETYLEFFTEPTKHIEKHFEARKGETYHDKITGEGSVNTMPINEEWYQLPENANLREPKYTNADHVHHLIPHVKIIAMIRDHVER